jgi:hypothetical protein
MQREQVGTGHDEDSICDAINGNGVRCELPAGGGHGLHVGGRSPNRVMWHNDRPDGLERGSEGTETPDLTALADRVRRHRDRLGVGAQPDAH